jgi:hypothetical protein
MKFEYLFNVLILQVGIVNMMLIKMILLRDMVRVLKNGYFMVSYSFFTN